jgi:hypothetical protein
MKTTVALICLWLVGVAAAQKAPATIKLSPAEIYMTNRSAKEIIGYVLIYTFENRERQFVPYSKINCKTKNSLSMYTGRPDTSCKSKTGRDRSCLG